MTAQTIQTLLDGKELVDVLLTGFVEKHESPVRFYALLETLYLQCGGSLLRFGTVGDSGRMRIEVATAIEHTAALDDDMTPALTSIRQQMLRDPDGANVIAASKFWNPTDEVNSIVCSAASIDLANGQHIFVDPSNHFGIQVGGRELEESWSAARDGTS